MTSSAHAYSGRKLDVDCIGMQGLIDWPAWSHGSSPCDIFLGIHQRKRTNRAFLFSWRAEKKNYSWISKNTTQKLLKKFDITRNCVLTISKKLLEAIWKARSTNNILIFSSSIWYAKFIIMIERLRVMVNFYTAFFWGLPEQRWIFTTIFQPFSSH